MAVASTARPDLDFQKAERVEREGVEIRRDISLAMTSKPILDVLYERHPDIIPARIIESDQGEGKT